MAAQDTEFLTPGESYGSENLKIVRIVRRLREMRIQEPKAHLAIVGLLSTKILTFTTTQMEKERFVVKEILYRARTRALELLGENDKGVIAYVPYKCVPIERPGQVVLYALPWAPRPAGPYMWDQQPKIQTPLAPDAEASLSMVYDHKAHEQDEKNKEKLDNLVWCEVEVAIWDSKTNIRKIQFLPDAKVSLTISAVGIEEVAGELTALKIKLKALNLAEKFKWGFINKVEVSIKGEAGLEFKRGFDRGKFTRLFSEWQAKFKASLSFELKIPKTSIKLPIEITPYIDQAGAPGVEFQVKILDF